MSEDVNRSVAKKTFNNHLPTISKRFNIADEDGDGMLLDDILRSEQELRIVRAAGGRYISGMRKFKEVTTYVDPEKPNHTLFKLKGKDWFSITKKGKGSFEYRELSGSKRDVIAYNEPKLSNFYRFSTSGFYPKRASTNYSLSTPIFTAGGAVLDDATLAQKIKEADFILLGEYHGNYSSHRAQRNVIKLMIKNNIQFGIGLEMVDLTHQPVLDEFNKGRMLVSDLSDEVNWRRNWGKFQSYAPVIELAREYRRPLVALNLPRKVVRRFGRKGREALSADEIKLLPPEVLPPMSAALDDLIAVARMHHVHSSGSITIKSVVRGQALRDSIMAYRGLDSQKRVGKMVILAGDGHVRNGWGIPWRIRTLDKSKKLLVISPYSKRKAFKKSTFVEQLFYMKHRPTQIGHPTT